MNPTSKTSQNQVVTIVAEDFNERGPSWSEIMTSAGWSLSNGPEGGAQTWRKPGCDRGCQAWTRHPYGDGGDVLRVFGESGRPFEMNRPYSKFAAYAVLHHSGDLVATAFALQKQGFGRTHQGNGSPPGTPPNAPQASPQAAEQETIHLSDRGNAVRLAQAHGHDLRWVAKWQKWIVWDGKRWKLDDEFEVRRRAILVLKKMYDDATDEMVNSRPSDDRLKVLQMIQSFACRCEMAPRLNAVVDLLRSEPGIKIDHTTLDSDPWLLNCTNATIDLRTGQARDHCRDDLLTKLCPTRYEPDAKCPLWERTLVAIFDNKQPLVAYMQRLAGYCATGSVREQVLPICWGEGSNGKSLLFNTLSSVLGSDFAGPGAEELLQSGHLQAHTTFLADLFGMRLVTLAETREGGRLNEALIKRLTGGDLIKARRMREDNWSFTPTHKILLATNHKPDIKGRDHGTWRRLRLVPFTVKFWEASKGQTGPDHLRADETLPERLKAEAAGILGWIIRGCLEWQKGGLREPKEVQGATADYRAEQDDVVAFLSERCELGPELCCSTTVLYAAFQDWHEKSGEADRPMPSRRFKDALATHGIERVKNSVMMYTGVALSIRTPFE